MPAASTPSDAPARRPKTPQTACSQPSTSRWTRTWRRYRCGIGEERRLHAVDDGRHVDEVDGDPRSSSDRAAAATTRAWPPSREVRVRPHARRRRRPAGSPRPVRHPGTPRISKVVVHGVLRRGLAGAERHEQLAARWRRRAPSRSTVLSHSSHSTSTSAGRPSSWGGCSWPSGDAQQVHLQRLDQKILCIPAIRTRQRQNRHSVRGPSHVAPVQECISLDQRSRRRRIFTVHAITVPNQRRRSRPRRIRAACASCSGRGRPVLNSSTVTGPSGGTTRQSTDAADERRPADPAGTNENGTS